MIISDLFKGSYLSCDANYSCSLVTPRGEKQFVCNSLFRWQDYESKEKFPFKTESDLNLILWRLGNFGFIEGCPFGTAATMICSGYIIESSLGWPSVFYVTGIVTILWGGVWLIFASNTPTECMIISQGERDYICKSIGPIKSSSVRDYVSICIYMRSYQVRKYTVY
jgi:hypothetical protein